MQSNKISLGSGCALAALVIITNGFSVMPGSGAGRDAWISGLLAGAAALFCAVCVVAVCEKYPGMLFGQAVEKTFGKVLGSAANFALMIVSVITCTVSLTVFSRFVQITALPRTPQIIIPLLISVLSALAIKSGLRAAAGSARLLFGFVLLVFIIFIFFGIRQIDYGYMLPRFSSLRSIITGAGEVFLNRFGTIFALGGIYTRLPQVRRRKSVFLGSVFLSALALAAISAITVATLGEETTRIDFYPVFTAMSVRGVGGFIQHTEILACLAMTLCLFFKCAVCIAFSDDQLAIVFKTRRKKGCALPLALISASLTHIIYRDISSLRGIVEWREGFGAVVFGVILFSGALFLVSGIKRKLR